MHEKKLGHAFWTMCNFISPKVYAMKVEHAVALSQNITNIRKNRDLRILLSLMPVMHTPGITDYMLTKTQVHANQTYLTYTFFQQTCT